MRNRFALPVSIAAWAVAALAAAALLSGCLGERVAGGTGVGNPPQGSVIVALQAASVPAVLAKQASSSIRNPDGTFTVSDAGGTRFTVKSSFANVGRIKVELPAGLSCTDAPESTCESGSVRIDGPFVANLMTGAWQPALTAFKVPVGRYRRIEVRLEAEHDANPALDPALAGHSMVIKGTFDYAGVPDRAFSIALDFDEDEQFQSDSDMTVGAAGINKLVVSLDVEKWLAATDITRCLDDKSLVLGADGNLEVNHESGCSGLEQGLKDAVKGSGGLHEERDGGN